MFGGVSSIAMVGSDLYAGGQFEAVGGDPAAANLVRWNGATWSAVGTKNPGHPVFEAPVAEVLAVGGVLYVAGNFEDAAGIAQADHIAMWDGHDWSALGSDVSGNGAISGAFPIQIEALAAVGDDLYVGGNFTDAGGDPTADYIARWDGKQWHGVGSNGEGNGALTKAAKAILPVSGGLYVGGNFEDAGSLPSADFVAFFDTNNQTWLPLGSNDAGQGQLQSSVYTLAKIGSNIYAGGRFVNLWGSGNYVSRWDGTSWHPVGGNTLNGDVFALAEFNGHLIAGGDFNIPADYIAILDNGAWSTLGPDEALDYTVESLLVNGTDVYAGGQFSNAGGMPLADRIAVLRTASGAHRPDARIRKGNGPIVGNNIYNDNGGNQALSGSKGVGQTITFTVSIQNDGDFKERFRVHAEGAPTSMYVVRYFRGTTEITSAVTNGTYLTSAVEPGKAFAVTVKVKVKTSATSNSVVTRLITATALSDPVIDAVRLRASRN
jgi:hypothetical protein